MKVLEDVLLNNCRVRRLCVAVINVVCFGIVRVGNAICDIKYLRNAPSRLLTTTDVSLFRCIRSVCRTINRDSSVLVMFVDCVEMEVNRYSAKQTEVV